MIFRIYFERKKLVFNSKIDKFTTYDNKISDLKTKKTEYLKMIQGIDEQISNIVDERRDYGIKQYLDKKKEKNYWKMLKNTDILLKNFVS